MIGRASSFLGLAVGERAIMCAEVQVAGDRRTVRRTATFALDGDLSLDKPHAVGQALAAFLRQRRFSTSRVVVGLPARWLMAVEKELPPADAQQARDALRLQAERVGAAESAELVFDYAGTPRASAPSRVLLVATPRQRLARVEEAMEAAGMSVVAVTSTALTVASCAQKLSQNAAVLLLNRSGAEMVWRDDGTPRMLRHVALSMNGHGTPMMAPLGAALRRTVAFAGANGAVDRELLVLDGVGLPQDQMRMLGERLGVGVRAGDPLATIGVSGDPQSSDVDSGGEYTPAMALAVAGAQMDLLPLDFSNSRLTLAKPKRIGRRGAWAIVLAILAVVGISYLYVTVRMRSSELAGLTAQLDAKKQPITDAKTMRQNIDYSRGFFDSRPALLECLRQVTLAFRDDEHIWVTSLTIKDNGKGTITGKAASQQTALTLYERLKKNSRFTDVKAPELHEGENRSREVTFNLNFTFNFVE